LSVSISQFSSSAKFQSSKRRSEEKKDKDFELRFDIVMIQNTKYLSILTNMSKSLGMHTHIKDVPDIARTSPTLSVVKFKPPNLLGLTAHNEKT
jgi:hypothetical protein